MNLKLRKIVLTGFAGVVLSACSTTKQPSYTVPVETPYPTSVQQGEASSYSGSTPYQPPENNIPINTAPSTTYVPTQIPVQATQARGGYIPSNAPVDLSQPTHTVVYGDTVYNISKRYRINQQQLRAWNHLSNNTIHIGQVLKVRANGTVGRVSYPAVTNEVPLTPTSTTPVQPVVQPIQQPIAQQGTVTVKYYTPQQFANYQPPSSVQTIPATATQDVGSFHAEPMEKNLQVEQKVGASPLRTVGGVTWMRPVNAPISQAFTNHRKGVTFSGSPGMPVYAAASGRVVYAGESPTLRQYGKVLIIQHNKTYLSAYGNNQSLLVHSGDTVSLGQQVATMGNQLHFEIRQDGTPVNPVDLLPYK